MLANHPQTNEKLLSMITKFGRTCSTNKPLIHVSRNQQEEMQLTFEVEYENNQAELLSYLAEKNNDMVYPEAPGVKITYDNENGQFSIKYNEDSSDFLADRVWI